MAPTVSVVIPTFNRSMVLTNAIDSVLRQTYADYEIVVIDDGSTDDTHERLRPYTGRIEYFYQDNRGLSAAQNKGIELAKGEWISVLADDDEWLPTKLERQFAALDILGKDFGACFTDCEFVGRCDFQQTAFEAAGLKKRGPLGILDKPVPYVLARHPVILVQSLLVRRSLLTQLGGFDEAMLSEDTDLILRLSLKTRFCFVSDPLVKIDRTPSRSRLSEFVFLQTDEVFSNIERMHRKWLALPELVDPEARGQIEESLRAFYCEWIIRKIRQFQFFEAIGKMRQAKDIGGSYSLVVSKLALRAARKVSASLTRRFVRRNTDNSLGGTSSISWRRQGFPRQAPKRRDPG
ncbi:MAG TPA: glycosyltransferase [Candidatus Acidoferrales bacterium]|nr:glycosyltransferase [Candidatus Acidoferrales bacterium]